MTSMKEKLSPVLYHLAEELFDMARGLGELSAEIALTPYGKLRYPNIPRSTYYKKIKKFERYGLLKKIKKPHGSDYVLTDRAKWLRQKPPKKTRRTDKLSTLIIFDIPEKKHKARDNFRRYLIKNGYTQIQKSAFLSPFKISNELKEFIRELGIASNVTILASKIEQL